MNDLRTWRVYIIHNNDFVILNLWGAKVRSGRGWWQVTLFNLASCSEQLKVIHFGGWNLTIFPIKLHLKGVKIILPINSWKIWRICIYWSQNRCTASTSFWCQWINRWRAASRYTIRIKKNIWWWRSRCRRGICCTIKLSNIIT